MIVARSMDVRDNFKTWCGQIADGEIVKVIRPGNNCIYMISQKTYDNFAMIKRMASYASYFYGKDKITNLKRLSDIEKLPDNWNNNGADRIQDDIIRFVRRFLLVTEYQPEVFPTACDAVQLEWDNDKGEYLEMEVRSDIINVFRIDSDGNEQESTLNVEIDSIKEVVNVFFDK